MTRARRRLRLSSKRYGGDLRATATGDRAPGTHRGARGVSGEGIGVQTAGTAGRAQGRMDIVRSRRLAHRACLLGDKGLAVRRRELLRCPNKCNFHGNCVQERRSPAGPSSRRLPAHIAPVVAPPHPRPS